MTDFLPSDTNSRRTLSALVLLIACIIIPSASAELIIDESLSVYIDSSKSGIMQQANGQTGWNSNYDVNGIYFKEIELYSDISYIGIDVPGAHGTEGVKTTNYNIGGKSGIVKIRTDHSKNYLGQITLTRFTLFPQDWDNSGLSGEAYMLLDDTLYRSPAARDDDVFATPRPDLGVSANNNIVTVVSAGSRAKLSIAAVKDWRNDLTIDKTDTSYEIELQRIIDGNTYPSIINLIKDGVVVFSNAGSDDKSLYRLISEIDKITIDAGIKTFDFDLGNISSVTPPVTVSRTGTVTMTDNNGTTITGFEVTAVNAYTGESYTVATDTDVAVITLPMDRTTQMRDPWTGEYEQAPVGYYRFFGQSPGYKMLVEEGIQVAVMPEKYGSYQLCDIGVTSETGYLTGNHQFQIRSRSDNSILQTGTISAKSATTGEWYNTTVSGGIATLVLPYDTSNVVSQYAGNYYVYATSPGYEDSDYGTQIVVMPHTVSEIKAIHLTPIGGIPTPGNVTLRIQTFSETGPGIPNAEIFIAGVLGAGSDVWDTYTASSTGYLTVSVPGNSTYDIVARGAGYYDSARRVEVFTEAPPLIEIKLYLSGAPTVEPSTQPTGWPTDHPTTQPTGGIPDDDDDSEGFLIQAVRGIGLAFGVGFATAKIIFGMLLALSIGYATAKQLRGGAAEFGLGLLGGVMLGVLIGLLPVWIIVVLLLVVGLYIGNRYVGGGNHG